ncbi:NAD(P)-binding protein [Inmirania thermothiophila]|uniref:NADPH-dependent glutamate synthase beta subunit-like oxidoreductase n=1 Tax=Inmirania thermothiophila TaxID=1750597 RepID=A0A3N1Y017_9GAMM|nr:NAD(P)-binding protein [Inmirania thermothiophila]ROR32169.1 NADPH-dependent glutamate synthase beta subunit-like oxidoreductase [Inmirania thermothiophila]
MATARDNASPAAPAKSPEERTFRRFREGDSRYRRLSEKIFQSGWSHKCPTYVLRTPPCSASCPSGHDIRGWLNIVRGMEKPAEGMSWQEYAFRRATAANPFPAIMGRVCPAPCESGCNRNQVEDHVGINAVEHYIGDYAIAAGYRFDPPAKETGKKVAIIGGGPAGLAAAYHLRRMGHACTIFDEHEKLGGMMRYGIPGFRTPRTVLDAEIQRILDMGVEVRTRTRVGTDVSVAELEREFDAIFWAIGAQSGRALDVPGGDAPNVITGVAFLNAYNDGRMRAIQGRVVVIGGGDTSIDVATVARRLGHITKENPVDHPERSAFGQMAHDVAETARAEGADVVLITRRPVDKMAAQRHEVEEALRIGVEIRDRLQPVAVVVGEDGRAKALRVVRTELKDGQVVPVEGSEEEIEADLIVAAIGQQGDFTGYEDLNNGRGFIDPDRNFQVKGKPGHFVAGDIIRPHLLTTAIGQARIAAESIDHYLRGEPMAKRPKVDVHHFNLLNKLAETGHAPAEVHEPVRGTSESDFAVHNFEDRSQFEVITHEELFLGHFPYTPRIRRRELELPPEVVLKEEGADRLERYTDEEAQKEASRCMSCGLCFECDNCVVFCPQDAVHRVPKSQRTTGRYVYTDYTRCIGCHICHDVCPTGYIQMGLGE